MQVNNFGPAAQDRPLARVLAALKEYRRQGRQYTARCPAHEDRTPSLSVTDTADGTVLLTCFAGCHSDAVVRALGLEWSDLFPGGRTPPRSTVTPPSPGREARALALHQPPRSSGITPPTAPTLTPTPDDPSPAPADPPGIRVTAYDYHDAAGRPVYRVKREDLPSGRVPTKPDHLPTYTVPLPVRTG